MRNETRDSAEARTLGQLVDDIEVAMLVSIAPDGQTLVSRPLVTLRADPKGNLWFFIRDDSGKAEDVVLNPQVNLAYADPAHHVYVSVVGRASLVRDRRKIEELWSSRFERYFPAGSADPALCLLRVDVQSAEYWQQGGDFMRRAVEMLGSITGTDSDIEEHQRINLG